MLAVLLAALTATQGLQNPPPETGAATPAYAADGRLALSLRGNLWIRTGDSAAAWIPLTSGVASDREPAWWPDGGAIVFASDRSGSFDLWRVAVGPEGPLGQPERLTSAPEWEGEPTVGPDGEIVFVRGRGPGARLIRRAPDGSERLLTQGRDGAEHWPAYAPDGRRVAYVTTGARGHRLRIRWLDADSTSTVLADRAAERPAWSPEGDRLAFAVRGAAPGTWVTPVDGSYVNLVATAPAAPAWSPDGSTLALAALPPADAAYNGDPARGPPRELAGDYPATTPLWFAAAPQPPDAAAHPVPAAPVDRAAANAAAFDRMWQRSARIYFSQPQDAPRYARWERLRGTYRPRALSAHTDQELGAVLHDMWQQRPPLRRPAIGRSAVSSAHPLATAAGLEILRLGGNVVDAAVAVSFALGVVEPDASGIGGYGQMLIRVAPLGTPTLIEFMTRVPEEASLANAQLLNAGAPPEEGPVLANVPGTVAGMHLAWQKYGSGRVSWAQLIAPAIRAAEDGFPVSDGLATTLRVEREHFTAYEGSRALFFPGGKPLQAGETFRNPDLGRALRLIADSGPGAFYRGSLAHRIVADLRGHGNAMRLTDLARYYAAEREPVSGTYRGYTIYSSAPPSAGGATLVAQLNLLEQYPDPEPYPEDLGTLHAMIEAWKLVPSTRGRIADPGLWPVRTEAFVSKDSARARWRCFRPERALTPSQVGGDPPGCATPGRPGHDPEQPEGSCTDADGPHCHRAGTTAFVVADAEGHVVAVTQTLGTWGGNFYVSPGLGFLYNDKLTSYGTDPDQYGARLPNARHGSSLAPTIVFQGAGAQQRPVLAAGAAGNAWITSAVYAIVTGVVDQRLDVQHAIELPRFLLTARRGRPGSSQPFGVQLEAGTAPGVAEGLGELGDVVSPISLPGELRMGYAAAVALENGRVVAAADPRRSGAAGAIGCGPPEVENCQINVYPR